MEERRDTKWIEDAIEKYVNGGIRDIATTLKSMDTKIDNHIEEDRKWKEKVNPILDSIPELNSVGAGVKWFSMFGRGAKAMAGVVIAVGAVITAFIAAIRFILQ